MPIKISSLSTDKLTEKSLEKDYLYKDVFFDLLPSYSYNNRLNKKEYLKDIQSLYDLESVKNSIINHFLTSPGQKILNPTFGIDLRRFLFEPVDDFVADIIQEEIQTKLPRSEPRVQIQNVNVEGIEEDNSYIIDLTINVPSLGAYGVLLKSELSSRGFTLI